MRNITKADFNEWKDSEVTQRFMAYIAEGLRDAHELVITGDTEQIVRLVHARNEAMQIYNEVLEWKPDEIINQEEESA